MCSNLRWPDRIQFEYYSGRDSLGGAVKRLQGPTSVSKVFPAVVWGPTQTTAGNAFEPEVGPFLLFISINRRKGPTSETVREVRETVTNLPGHPSSTVLEKTSFQRGES